MGDEIQKNCKILGDPSELGRLLGHASGQQEGKYTPFGEAWKLGEKKAIDALCNGDSQNYLKSNQCAKKPSAKVPDSNPNNNGENPVPNDSPANEGEGNDENGVGNNNQQDEAGFCDS